MKMKILSVDHTGICPLHNSTHRLRLNCLDKNIVALHALMESTLGERKSPHPGRGKHPTIARITSETLNQDYRRHEVKTQQQHKIPG